MGDTYREPPLLTHEPQNREMALIRCPNCDTLHDIDGSFFSGAARRVRCASCREVWEATDPESNLGPMLVIPKRAAIATSAAPSTAEEVSFEGGGEASHNEGAALDQSAIDSMDFSSPETEKEISQEELEALFAEDGGEKATAATVSEAAGPVAEPIEFNPESLARAQDAAMAQADAPSAKLDSERRNRRAKRLAAADAHHAAAKPKGRSSMAVMLMAAGIGTLATLGLMRQETVRLFPESAVVFEAVGLGTSKLALDIRDVTGKLVLEDDRETLNVTGTITNLTKSVQKVPVLRLSVRNKVGHEIYVWTAAADQPEIAPGATTSFRRRLASPPGDSHSVMVRFVAKDDIVAAIR